MTADGNPDNRRIRFGRTIRRLVVAGWLSGLVSACTPAEPSAPPRFAIAHEAVRAVLEAFQFHTIVALGEGAHGNEQSHAFRLALVRDPRFAVTVNDIVVEFGSARYQDLMDRFVRGEVVPDTDLRRVWQNTTQPHEAWDVPVYEEFFRTVRAVNASLPPERHMRVLLGDPPIDWVRVRTPEDLQRALAAIDRDRYPVDLIRREVVAKQRRALVLYGNLHLLREDPFGGLTHEDSIVRLLEAGAEPTKVFTIWTHASEIDLSALQPNVRSWRAPSLALLKRTILGSADFTFYYPFETFVDGKPVRARSGPRMEDEFDALLYLGPASALTRSRMSPALCADAEYLTMRYARLALIPRSPGMGDPAERLKEYCSAVTAK